MKNFLVVVVLLVASAAAFASEPLIWSVNSRSEVLKGDARGLSVDQDGTISLFPRLAEVFKTEQSYIWSSKVDSAGNIYLGTGGDGKVFKVDSSGKGALFADLTEMNVTSIAIGKGGEIYAATSPDGKVYRIDAAGKADVYFSPKEKYIWSLAVMSDGSLAVATGDGGKIYKVKTANAAPEASILFDTSETHIISLATDNQGNLIAGSDSNGLVIRFGPDGRPFGLLDSPLREIHDIAIGADGSIYVLALGDSASAPKPADAAAASAASAESKTVTVNRPSLANPEPAAKSRYDLTGAKSAVYRILPDGGTDIIWSSTTVIGFSLLPQPAGNGVLLGTSDKGRIYSVYNDGREVLDLQTDASQISTLYPLGKGFGATSSNPGVLYQLATGSDDGAYESAVLDAKATATWGRIWWRSKGNVTLQTRSGNTEKADETWSAWSTFLTDPKGGQVASPKARYFQWRAVFKAGTSASLGEVNMAFVARNIAPEVLSITVLPTNVGLAANPPQQIDPNIELTGLDPAVFGIPNVSIPPRRVYQRGATSLQWTTEDRNGDRMVYDVFYREARETVFKLLKGDLADPFITIDGQSFADGVYVFKIVARDTPSNPPPVALSGERLTDPITIDNTAPVVLPGGTAQVTGDRGRVTFDASDSASYLVRAEYSVDGGEWTTIYADDGISDSPKERYTVDIPLKAAGEYAVTIRVYDAGGNSGNARAVLKK